MKLEPTPTRLVENFLGIKYKGGAMRVTEGGAVISRLETDTDGDSNDYETIYVCDIEFDGKLVPPEKPEHAVPINPRGLSPGDLWPSIYDGAKYSFSGTRFWWQNGATKLRHSFVNALPDRIIDELRQLRPDGGSFQITPAGDVLTQIPTEESPPDVQEQFRDLPRPVKRILKLRRDRGNVDMLPVYVGQLSEDDRPIEIEEATRLTDPLSEKEESSLEAWAAMGSYDESDLSVEDHRLDEPEGDR
ncbi:hypothetical protein [Natrinema pellirubrum]|nr:hypothetical protein [Natrinema pellirubrum]